MMARRDNPWIKCMQNFARFVRNIPAKIHRQPIKIAIIDDGVDGFLDLLDGKITAGKSFYPYSNSGDLMNSYYVPSGKHGTGMAALICQICPKCELFVARLEERYTMDGKRHITAKSAKEVRAFGRELLPYKPNNLDN
jgi:subtilisin family serine protease